MGKETLQSARCWGLSNFPFYPREFRWQKEMLRNDKYRKVPFYIMKCSSMDGKPMFAVSENDYPFSPLSLWIDEVRKHFHYKLSPFLEQFLSYLLLFPTDGLMAWNPQLAQFCFFQAYKKFHVLLLYYLGQELWRNCAVSLSICIDHPNLL